MQISKKINGIIQNKMKFNTKIPQNRVNVIDVCNNNNQNNVQINSKYNWPG